MRSHAAVLIIMLSLVFTAQGCRAVELHDAVAGKTDETSSIWGARTSGRGMEFELRQSDFEKDFVVYMDVDGQQRSWQLLRWTMRAGEIVLLSTGGRSNELSGNWAGQSVPIATFPVGKSVRGTHLVDVTSLFRHAFPEGWGVKAELERGSFQAPKAFPKNLVVRIKTPIDGEGTASVARWNFIRLPADPMPVKRLFGRTAFMHPGFVWGRFSEIPDGQYEVVQRWRLERARAVDAIAVPESPIIVHIDPGTPQRWRAWARKGIESWQPAFEAIGFKDAIQARELAPGERWDPEDLRYSVLCWTRDSDRCRSNVVDPRTGEILQFQVPSTDSALASFLARYVVTMAAVDSRVMAERLSDEFLGGFFAWVAAHETGHLLGLKDGGFGTFSYTPAQARDRHWVEDNGFNPSVMNYARFNYLAQPEDRMPEDLMLQKVGPTDLFWIRWGYSDRDSDEALTRLWNSNGLHRYRRDNGSSFSPYPYDGLETPGVSDPVEAALLGLKNLERSLALIGGHEFKHDDPGIVELVSPGELHEAALKQWFYINRQVVSLIGGRLLSPRLNSVGQPEKFNHPDVSAVDPWMQRKAVRFLCDSTFGPTPEYLVGGPVLEAAQVDRSTVEARIGKMREEISRLAEPHRVDFLLQDGGSADADEADARLEDLLAELKACMAHV